MKDQDKTKEELITELVGMRQRIAEMEGALVTLKQQEATRACGVVTDNTERQRFLSLLDAMPAYLCLMTPDYHLVFINRYFRERFGDPEGRRCYEFAFGLSEPCENCQSLIVLETKTPNEYEWLGPDGRTYLVCDQLVHDIDGSPLILEMGLDITERKRSEEALRKSEQRYRLLAENTQDVIWQTDLDLRFTYVNPAIAKVTGYTVDEWIGTRLTEHCDEENFMKMAQAVSEEISKGADSSGTILESVILKKNKEPMSTEIHGKVILGENDLPIALQGVARDISDRKRAEEALHRLNRELRAISACNQTLLRAVDEQTLLNEICRIICDEPGYRLAWVGYAENDDAKTIRPVAWAGFDSGYMAKANLTWSDDTERGRGPAGTVIRSGETVCVQDFTTDPRMAPWRESALQRGYRSGIALPLKDEGANVFGALLIYHSEPNAMTPNEIHLMEDLAGDLAFGIGVLRSRIERQQVEKSLRENEERLSLALQVSNAGRWEWNIQSDEVYFDVRFHEMLGYTMGELPNTLQEWLPYHHPGDMPILMSKAQTYLRGDSPIYESEHRIRNKAGTWTWVFTRGKSLDLTNTGSPRQFIGMAIDITDRKQWEQETEFKNLLLSTQQECSIDGILVVDQDGAILSYNSRFVRIWRIPPEVIETKSDELALKSVQDKLEHPQEFLEKVRYLYEHRDEISRDEIALKDGRVLDRYSSPMLGSDGRYYGRVWYFRDVTEQKTLQGQLLQAQKMEAVGTLAGGIAHDFNNILQVVLGYSELVLADEYLPDGLRDDLGKILLAARNGANLVQMLLTFSRKTDIKPLDLDLNQRICQTQKFLERTIPKMITIEMILAEDLDRIHADPTQMDQVLMNLAVNARDAMPEGGKLLIETKNVVLDEDYAKLHLEAKPGRYVLLSVSDTGSGMDKETLEHIFEPFFTTKAPGQGTGLGLAMVFGIVKQHHAFINCYSEVGHGTTFKIYLPAVNAETQYDQPVVISIPQGGTETILLVDDEELIRDLGKRILSKAGYTVLTASNGKEALDLYRSNKGNISLVILDFIMPEMDGRQCLKELLIINPGARVLIASGYSVDEPTKEALQGQARGFVSKPLDMRQLLQKVRKVLDET